MLCHRTSMPVAYAVAWLCCSMAWHVQGNLKAVQGRLRKLKAIEDSLLNANTTATCEKATKRAMPCHALCYAMPCTVLCHAMHCAMPCHAMHCRISVLYDEGVKVYGIVHGAIIV